MYRALELISLTIDAQIGKHSLAELTRLYEFVADYYLGDQIYPVDGEWLQKYFDSFIYQYLKEKNEEHSK
ncbi:MAG: hypothetical protein KBT04_05090 [Bacteroidales bacterium]|nr:hypothetical protein [Candidatus Colimorpha onthohippi]